jgi:D-alanine-D-alanine ligase
METRMVTDAMLAARLQQASALTFVALGGSGYGRCDLRLDANGDIYLLEINPNCSVFYPEGQYGSADFILANDPAGHRGFLEHLLACAMRHRERLYKPWELQYVRGDGFGLFARRAIQAGEIVERYEERPHVLVSRSQVARHWQGLRRQWFEQYAWPLTHELHVLWSDNPDDWRPLNHSCDPNTWLEGLDLVARRNIALGEELTIDYATFCGPMMSPFACHCGALDCRRVILGSDHLLPAIRQRYGEHVSDFVRNAWHTTSPPWCPPYEIVPNSFGLSLVARRAWRAGEVISPLYWGPRQSQPSRWTVQCGADAHAEPLPFELRYINHSCAPNVQFDLVDGVLRALHDIAPGDELCYFYPMTEWEMCEKFTCQCGATDCLGYIAGASQMPREILQRYPLSSVILDKLYARHAEPQT